MNINNINDKKVHPIHKEPSLIPYINSEKRKYPQCCAEHFECISMYF